MNYKDALTEMVSTNCAFILVCWHPTLTGSEGTKEGPETGNQDRTEVKSLYRRWAYNKVHSIPRIWWLLHNEF